MKASELQNHIIGIYKINFPNGKIYIGLSNNIKRRIKEHYSDSRTGMLCHKAIMKYYNNPDEIEVEILEQIDVEDYRILSELERKWIKYYQANDKTKGYNCTEGGIDLLATDNPYAKFSQEDIKIIKALLMDGHSNIKIANMYNVNPDTISRINTGKTYYDDSYTYPLRDNQLSTNIDRSGFNNHQAISKEQFDQIVFLLKENKIPIKTIAEQVGVYPTTISNINQGKTSYCPKDWAYPIRINKQNKLKLTVEDILNIHQLLREGQKVSIIAKQYDCSRDTISDINNGKRHIIEGAVYPIKPFGNKKPVSTISESGE